MSNVEKYKQLCDSFSLVYKGIHLNSAISLHLYDIACGKSLNLRKTEIYDIFRAYRFSKIKQRTSESNVLFFKGGGTRYNHNKNCNYLESTISDVSTSFTAKSIGIKYCFNIFLFIKIAIGVQKCTKSYDISAKEKIVLFSACMKYCNSINELYKADFSWVKKLVAFLYSHSIGDILTQYFNGMGVQTIAFADGLYMNYGENGPVDSINYLNFKSDKLLLWSQYSKEEYAKIGITEDKLKVCGFAASNTILPLKDDNQFRKCCVMLARNSFEEANFKLLKELSSLASDFEFHLKLHPLNDYSKYEKYAKTHKMQIVPKECTIDECIDKENFDFTIAVNTTTYYESLAKGVPCFRYCDGSFLLMSGLDDVFDSANRLISIINNYKEVSQSDYQELVNRSLEYSIGFGINNYRKYIIE